MGGKKDKRNKRQQSPPPKKQNNYQKFQKNWQRKLNKKQFKSQVFKASKEYMEHYQKFSNKLVPLKIKPRDVRGDGNCMFRSLSDQLYGSQQLHMELRTQSCNYILQNQQFFVPFLDQQEQGNMQRYIQSMLKNGQWGGHLQLLAISECKNIMIIIHRLQGEEYTIQPILNEYEQVVHLGYVQMEDCEHYVSIRDTGDSGDRPGLEGLRRLRGRYTYNNNNNGCNGHGYGYGYDGDEQMMVGEMQKMGIYQQQQQQYVQYGQQQQQQLKQPYPGYPPTKKCKCGSTMPYKSCCLKDYHRKLAKQ